MRILAPRSIRILVVVAAVSIALALFFPGLASPADTAEEGGPDLYDVDAFNANSVWAVGEAGTILHTEDVGQNWVPQDSWTSSNLYGVSVADGDTAWAVGEGGLILYTEDGGATWSPQDSGNTVALRSVSATAVDKAWAVGDEGTILYYDGEGWTEQESGVDFDLNGVSAWDESHVWAVGDRGIVYFDGTTWLEQLIQDSSDLQTVSAENADVVYAGGLHSHEIIVTADGGANWRTGSYQYRSSCLRPLNNYNFLGVTKSDDSLVAVGDNNMECFVLHVGPDTNRTSRQWKHAETLRGVRSVDGNHAWAVGDEGTIMFYDGVAWSLQNPVRLIPDMSSRTPRYGPAGMEVTVEGARFGSSQGDSRVYFDSTPASDYPQWSENRIVCEVPDGLDGSYDLTVVTDQGTSNFMSFSVPLDDPFTWYLAEGCTAGGFETWITIQNHEEFETLIAITYMTENGEVDGPVFYMDPLTRRTVNVADTLPDTWNVSARVDSDWPVVVERAVYWKDREGGHDSMASPTLSADWYLAEGCTAGGFETWLFLMNPQRDAAVVEIDFMDEHGRLTEATVTVDPQTRKSIDWAEYVPDTWGISASITSDTPIVVERAMYWNDMAGGHCTVGATHFPNTWYFGEGCTAGGFETWLLINNPNDEGIVAEIIFITEESGCLSSLDAWIGPYERASINVADMVPDTYNVAAIVESDHNIVVERAMYWNDREDGHITMGVPEPNTEWYLTEGCTAGSFESWLLLQYPYSNHRDYVEANVEITYLTEEGKVSGPTVKLLPDQRISINMADTIPGNHSVSSIVTSDQPIIAERSVYWDERAGGHNCIGVDVYMLPTPYR